jgi:Domain of unknown function (DUF4124)
MILPTVIKIMALAGLSLLMETSIASAQIFQWTDVKGVIHFTDNPYSIPESIRNTSALIVRKDMDTALWNAYDFSLLSFSRRFLSFFDNRLGFPFLDASRRG